MDRASSAAAQPLILTADPDLQEQLQELCAAAGLPVDLLADTARVRQPWARAGAVLIGDDLAGQLANLNVPRRDHVLIVAQAQDPSPLWRVAVELKADDVMVLPSARARLSAWLSDLCDGADTATTIAVTGGCGGAGASVLAVALALTAAKQGLPALLVDADSMGGGIELAVGCEHVEGLRWPDVAATRGRVGGAAFRAALPGIGELAVLSWGRSGPAQVNSDVVTAMVRSAQRGSRVVVIDLPRRLDEAASDALTLSDLLALVVTTDLRAIASTQAMLPGLRALCADVRLVVRAVRGSGLTAQSVADALDLPLAGVLPTKRSVVKAVNDGTGPGGRGRYDAASRRILHALLRSPGASR